jgi:large subunit ribosomal protein L17
MTREAVTRLFATVAPRYGDRTGGYLRITRSGFQQGDNAEKAFIELLGAEHELDEKRQHRAELRTKRREEMEAALAERQKPEHGGTQPGEE